MSFNKAHISVSEDSNEDALQPTETTALLEANRDAISIGGAQTEESVTIIYPAFFATFPLLKPMLRYGHRAEFWTMAPMVAAVLSGVAMSFTAAQLAINNINPHPNTLGTVNEWALAVVSGLRAICPWLFTSLFAIGVRYQILTGGIWLGFVMTLFALGFTVSSCWLPASADGEPAKSEQLEDEEASTLT